MKEQEKGKEETEGLWEGTYFRPAVDILETPEHLIIKADVPGIGVDHFDIDVKENVLTLTGQRQKLDERWKAIHQEFEDGHYFRKFRLGKQVDQSKIEATYKEGVLEIQIPMLKDPEPRKIEIRQL